METSDEIAKEFALEIREKKQAGRGIFSRIATRKSGRAVKFPSDYLTTKQKKALNGEVKRYFMPIPIISYEEFTNLPLEKRIQRFDSLREQHTVEEITEVWKMTRYHYYKLIKELEKVNTKDKEEINEQDIYNMKRPKLLQYIKNTLPPTDLPDGWTRFSNNVLINLCLKKDIGHVSNVGHVNNDNISTDTDTVPNKVYKFQITMNGECTGKELEDRLISLGEMLGLNNKYSFIIRTNEL